MALVPEGVKTLTGKGFTVVVERGAGDKASFSDESYVAAGATIESRESVLKTADILLKVLGPDSEIGQMKEGATLVSFLFPTSNLDTVSSLARKNITSFAMELVPRITRAQSMDALSSMSTIAGYRAALMAAEKLPRFFPMLMTAAGTLPPARVLILGAGVAGLQAIATCKRLGAIVEAFDVRPAVKEQVESLGAKFVSMPEVTAEGEGGYAKELSKDQHEKELALIASRLAKNDICITTALIPGKKAPILITRDMLKGMAAGSVIVDLAAANGGNCEATQPGETVCVDGVTIAGPLTLLSDMASDASRMYSKNMTEFLGNLAPKGEIELNMEDEIIRDTMVTHQGKVTHAPSAAAMEAVAR